VAEKQRIASIEMPPLSAFMVTQPDDSLVMVTVDSGETVDHGTTAATAAALETAAAAAAATTTAMPTAATGWFGRRWTNRAPAVAEAAVTAWGATTTGGAAAATPHGSPQRDAWPSG
jgi:hypothetical protein